MTTSTPWHLMAAISLE